MLTRLAIRGFKNLRSTELRFGALTCIAGPNGVGKSNVLDAIRFLSLLADHPFVVAAKAIRGGDSPRRLFSDSNSKSMHFEADMLIPPRGEDDFGQAAKAAATFVTYKLSLGLVDDADGRLAPRFRVEHESLSYVPRTHARAKLLFAQSRTWRESVVQSSRWGKPFISTEDDPDRGRIVQLHSDRMKRPDKKRTGGGKPTPRAADELPRTVLSSAQAAEETRTAVLVRQEMRRWKLLQLEPSALRQADTFEAEDSMISANGEHVPAALYRLAESRPADERDAMYARLANALAEILDGVGSVRVRKDESRRTLSFMLKDTHGLELPAESLSDGTMRFVALAVQAMDPRETGVLCMEEPENGIHPQRMMAMVGLLRSLAVDCSEPVGDDNPLRQVIVTTHSPLLARMVHPDELVLAMGRLQVGPDGTGVEFSARGLKGTWRSAAGMPTVPSSAIQSFLEGEQTFGGVEESTGTVASAVREQLQFDFSNGMGKEASQDS